MTEKSNVLTREKQELKYALEDLASPAMMESVLTDGTSTPAGVSRLLVSGTRDLLMTSSSSSASSASTQAKNAQKEMQTVYSTSADRALTHPAEFVSLYKKIVATGDFASENDVLARKTSEALLSLLNWTDKIVNEAIGKEERGVLAKFKYAMVSSETAPWLHVDVYSSDQRVEAALSAQKKRDAEEARLDDLAAPFMKSNARDPYGVPFGLDENLCPIAYKHVIQAFVFIASQLKVSKLDQQRKRIIENLNVGNVIQMAQSVVSSWNSLTGGENSQMFKSYSWRSFVTAVESCMFVIMHSIVGIQAFNEDSRRYIALCINAALSNLVYSGTRRSLVVPGSLLLRSCMLLAEDVDLAGKEVASAVTGTVYVPMDKRDGQRHHLVCLNLERMFQLLLGQKNVDQQKTQLSAIYILGSFAVVSASLVRKLASQNAVADRYDAKRELFAAYIQELATKYVTLYSTAVRKLGLANAVKSVIKHDHVGAYQSITAASMVYLSYVMRLGKAADVGERQLGVVALSLRYAGHDLCKNSVASIYSDLIHWIHTNTTPVTADFNEASPSKRGFWKTIAKRSDALEERKTKTNYMRYNSDGSVDAYSVYSKTSLYSTTGGRHGSRLNDKRHLVDRAMEQYTLGLDSDDPILGGDKLRDSLASSELKVELIESLFLTGVLWNTIRHATDPDEDVRGSAVMLLTHSLTYLPKEPLLHLLSCDEIEPYERIGILQLCRRCILGEINTNKTTDIQLFGISILAEIVIGRMRILSHTDREAVEKFRTMLRDCAGIIMGVTRGRVLSKIANIDTLLKLCKEVSPVEVTGIKLSDK